ARRDLELEPARVAEAVPVAVLRQDALGRLQRLERLPAPEGGRVAPAEDEVEAPGEARRERAEVRLEVRREPGEARVREAIVPAGEVLEAVGVRDARTGDQADAEEAVRARGEVARVEAHHDRVRPQLEAGAGGREQRVHAQLAHLGVEEAAHRRAGLEVAVERGEATAAADAVHVEAGAGRVLTRRGPREAVLEDEARPPGRLVGLAAL